jgi:hypothetical protein
LVGGGLLGLLATARWVLAIVANRSRGLDPSDESYYLMSALAPDRMVARQGDFAFYTRLLLRLGGSSLGGFRVAGMLALLVACACAARATSTLSARPVPQQRVIACALFPVVAALSLPVYSLWIITPGYNLLALVAALGVFAALLVSIGRSGQPAEHARRSWPLVLLAASSTLLVDAKFSAGGVVAVLCVCALVAVDGWRRTLAGARFLMLGAAIGAAVHLAVVGNPVSTARQTKTYLRMSSIADAYPMDRVWETTFVRERLMPWLLLMAACATAIAITWRWVRQTPWRTALMVAGATAMTVVFWDERARGADGLAGGFWWLRMTVGALVFITALAAAPSRRLAIGPVLALGALGLALGSNNGFVRQSALSAGLYGLAVLAQTVVVAGSGRSGRGAIGPAAIFVVATSAVSCAQVGQATAAPYRLGGSLESSVVPVHFDGIGTVEVSPDLARYAADLRALLPSIPDAALDCVVDLAGGTPVATLILGGRSATTPWMYGGTSGASRAADYLAERAPCVTDQVLVIEAPESSLGMTRPSVLVGRKESVLGHVTFRGYVEQVQVISVLEAATSG